MTQHETGNSVRVQRYRAKHRRIDYTPSPETLAIVHEWLARNPRRSVSFLIDYLVMAGHRHAISGNGER